MRMFKTTLPLMFIFVPALASAQDAGNFPDALPPSGEGEVRVPDSYSAPPVASAPLTGAAAAAPRPAPPRNRGGPEDGDSWEFTYSGYFRAPMRLAIAKTPNRYAYATESSDPFANSTQRATDADGNLLPPGTTGTKTSIQNPVIPDDQYASWQNSAHNRRDWAEMFFSVGNGQVSGNLAIQGFQFTDSAWANPKAQFGIGQGWLEINHDLGFENVNFNAKVGSHWNRYGMAGIYDGGEYDTYLFGRTHLMGGSVRADIDLQSMTLGLEGGFGVHRPDPELFNRARFTPAAHGHVFAEFDGVEFSAHILHAWSNQQVVGGIDATGDPNGVYGAPLYPSVAPGSNCGYEGGQATGEPPGVQCATDFEEFAGGANGSQGVFGPEYPTGSQTIFGGDARFDFGLLGYLYAGYSHQVLDHALTVSNAIESIHSLGAGEFNIGVVDNYLESTFCPISAFNESCSDGSGSIGTALLQYELGLANFGMMPGDMDLRFKLYSMLNFVNVDDTEVGRLSSLWDANGDGVVSDEDEQALLDDVRQDGVKKFKFGVDTEFFPVSWLSTGLRFDHLRPNSKVSQQNFSILSPRISLRTKMVTHETISLQYSRYFYAQRECTATDPASGAQLYSSPADDNFRQGTTNPGPQTQVAAPLNPSSGLPLSAYCVQPPASSNPPDGFGAHSSNQSPGSRGAPTLTPDVNVIKLEATMWW